MNGTDTELRKELWMWRGFIILLLIINLITVFITFSIDRTQHAVDNAQRAAAWQELRDRTNGNRNMIMKNHEAILAVDEHLRQCAGCHSHPKLSWQKDK